MTIYRIYRLWRRWQDAAVIATVIVGLLLATGVIGPTLDRHDAERAAVAHR